MDARSAFLVAEPGVKVVPPPEGLARGRYEVPRWTIVALALVIGLIAVGWIVQRLRKAQRDAG